MKTAMAVILVLGVIGLAIWAEVAVWMECRETHSWLYCMRTIP